ncbi:MAG TPA: hypothetical protein VLE53_14985 [Gemmatimonadaceae bacterium]|nr:hypothetical protein [Gemmatimonadaceae bacterium]
MPIVPLYGHTALRERLSERVRGGTLPQSLLLHGPAGVGKQRLALWLAQALLCERETPPCGECRQCRFALELSHPDLLWVFPRPRPRDADPEIDDVAQDMAKAVRERVERRGLYPAPPGSESLFVSTVRYLVHGAVKTPAIAARKVFVVGEADRMVVQEGSEFAANAFLKLLEEPPADTWIIVTTSALAALIPTVRSRLVAVRVPPLDDASVQAFVADPSVSTALDELGLPGSREERVRLAQGAPGMLLTSTLRREAVDEAERFLAAAQSRDPGARFKLALAQGNVGARGGFSDVLDALTLALHDRLRRHAEHHDETRTRTTGRAMDAVEEAKRLAEANVSPQLITVRLLEDLSANLP